MPLKPLTVSSIFTCTPGVPVNTAATSKGCDRNRSIFRARATICLSSSEFVHTEDRYDVLQRLIALKNLLHLAGDIRSAPRPTIAAVSMREVEFSGSTAG